MCNLCLKAGMSRRLLMGAGLATAATLSFANKSAQAQPARLAETPDAALKLLVDGNARYVSGQMNERDFSAGRAARAQGQAPFASILGCADSRVSPELAFDQIPGDLFVVRVAGNVAGPDELAKAQALTEKLKAVDAPASYDTIGWVQYRLGNTQEALKYLLRAWDKANGLPTVAYHLAVVYQAKGDASATARWLDKALAGKAQFPERAAASAELAKLRGKK